MDETTCSALPLRHAVKSCEVELDGNWNEVNWCVCTQELDNQLRTLRIRLGFWWSLCSFALGMRVIISPPPFWSVNGVTTAPEMPGGKNRQRQITIFAHTIGTTLDVHWALGVPSVHYHRNRTEMSIAHTAYCTLIWRTHRGGNFWRRIQLSKKQKTQQRPKPS